MKYQVKRKDGFVWINLKSGEPEPHREVIDDQEPGFDPRQAYKLAPLKVAAPEAPAAPTAEQPAAAPANRMVTGKSLKRREA